MKKVVVCLFAAVMGILAVSPAYPAVSESAVLFLLITPNARAAGMGEAFVAVADDATAAFWNPAGLAFQQGREVTLTHTNWLRQLVDDMSFEYLAYKQHVPSLGGTIGGSVTFFNLGEQVHTAEYTDSEGRPIELGTFNSWELGVSVCYGTQLGENLGLGAGMRYIRSALAPFSAGSQQGKGIGNSFSVDLGVLNQMPFLKALQFGANLSNMGPKITYIDAAQADPLPTNLKIGLSYKVLDSEFNKLRIAIDTNKLMVVRKKDEKPAPFYEAIFTAWGEGSLSEQARELITCLGAEYVYNKMIFLRAGYYYDEEGKVKYPAFGAGLQYSLFRFDFGYVAAESGHPLADTMRFTLTANL